MRAVVASAFRRKFDVPSVPQCQACQGANGVPGVPRAGGRSFRFQAEVQACRGAANRARIRVCPDDPRRCMRVRPVLPCRSGRRRTATGHHQTAPRSRDPGRRGWRRASSRQERRAFGGVSSPPTAAPPFARAQVRVSGPDIGMKVATTDEGGRFEFVGLPAGRFILAATKSGYVSVQYGQTRPFESGKPIELAEAQILDKADILMPARERNIRNAYSTSSATRSPTRWSVRCVRCGRMAGAASSPPAGWR